MSGPVAEVAESRLTEVGGLPVHRALPRHGRRMVGAWCFLDHFGPVEATPQQTMTVGPHPHIGLHTVTWLFHGEVLHTDSLGNQQLIRPGQLNLMTAGQGIAHAEDSRGQTSGLMDGAQLWVAQPEATRHGPSSFAHCADLPRLDIGATTATVFMGELLGVRSPVSVETPLVGADLAGHGTLDLALEPSFEYGIAVLHGALRTEGASAGPDEFVYLGSGRSHLQLDLGPESRLILLGGEPFAEEIFMWWNFVARTREEVAQAQSDWNAHAGRSGPVASDLERIPAPRPFWVS